MAASAFPTATSLATLASLADAARDLAKPVPSPCISVCQMDRRSGLCEGCLRTIDEISAWSVMSEADKRSVWASLLSRQVHVA
jgi:uncharacterized protein